MRALLITISIWVSLGLSNTSLAETRLKVGVAFPRAQLGQGNGASADVAEPVRQALMSYLKGPISRSSRSSPGSRSRSPRKRARRAARSCCTRILHRSRRAAA